MPTRANQTVLLLLGLSWIASTGLSQSPSGAAPGQWHGDKFIGYVPPHLKASAARQRPTTMTSTRSITTSDEQPVPPTTRYREDPPVHIGGAHEFEPGYFHEPDWGGAPYCGPDSCFAPMQFWGRAEYLLWWTRGMNAPPLATTSPAGTTQGQAGLPGRAGTTVLFGGDGLNDDVQSGGRFTLGAWLDPCRLNGIEVTYLTLGEERESFAGSDAQFNILARPFFNVQNNVQVPDSRLIAFPGFVSGSLNIDARTEFQTLTALYRRAGIHGCHARVDFLLGYRFAELEDGLLIRDNTLGLAGPAEGTAISLFDRFESRNTFHGVEFGAMVEWQASPCWSWEVLGKVALGNTRSITRVAGQTITTAPDAAPVVRTGGLLTQPTNIGRFEQDDFSSIGEVGVTLRRDFGCGLSATFGYRFMYWMDVVRAGEQVDLGVNPTQLTGPLAGAPRPAFPFNTSDFWAQGLSFGLEYSF